GYLWVGKLVGEPAPTNFIQHFTLNFIPHFTIDLGASFYHFSGY
ncbi:MAG: hypothetical protein RLZZ338_3295, partial [Cyanobacteriota bacterium]